MSDESPDADAPSKDELASLLSRGFEPVTGNDWIMGVLAVLDVLMLAGRDAYGERLPALVAQSIVWVDLAVLALFALEFLTRMFRASSKLSYTKNHWYDVVGLVPIAHVGLRAFRLVRFLRMYTVVHFPPEADLKRSWLTALVRGVIHHYRALLVEEISDPIVLASLNIIEGPLTKAQFAATIGSTLDQRREHIQTVVADAVRHTRGMGSIMRTSAGQRMVRNITDSVLETAVHTLESEELNQVIGESIRGVLNEVRAKVRVKEYKAEGGSLLRPASRRLE